MGAYNMRAALLNETDSITDKQTCVFENILCYAHFYVLRTWNHVSNDNIRECPACEKRETLRKKNAKGWSPQSSNP